MRDALIIFLKNPIKGKVKTRLAETIGEEKALQIYLKLVEHTLSLAKNHSSIKFLFFSDVIGDEYSGWEKRVQSGGDLGERMFNAFEEMRKEGFERTCIIGTDCAELTTDILNEAFLSLQNHDLVIGPALDGGYYLLGMKQLHQELFEGIDWSTDSVFSDTLKIAESKNLQCKTLKVLRDIDIEDDLVSLPKDW